MKEKFNVIADNLHLKGWTKYLVPVVFFGLILFLGSKLLSFKPKENNTQDIVFKLNGTKVVTLYAYDEITDEGVTATDEYGRDISSKVVKVGNVDTSKIGVYDVVYKLNTNGNELKLERTYVVIANDGAYIELIGNKIINLALGSEYSEPGYKAYNNSGNDVSDKVIVTNNINTNKVGEYTVVYSLKGSDDEIKSISRTVRVHDTLPDSLNLELQGSTSIDLIVGSTYTEPGYKAYDNDEGDLTDKVVVEGTVDTNKKGIYIIKYTITNSIGVQKTLKRIVNVYEEGEGTLSLVLNGKEEIQIIEGSNYSEPGYMAIDSVDGNITSKVTVNGEVNTNKVGSYTITYTVTNSRKMTKTLTRIVNVYSKNSDNIIFTLLGDNPMKVENGGTYNDPGYKANSLYDGNLNDKVIVEGKVNTNLPGTYNVTYTLTYSGITKTLTRKVIVSSDLTIKLTNQTKEYNAGSVDILVEVFGDEFNKLYLPDGTIVNSTKTIYKATKNQEYVFKAYNKNNREFTNSIKVTNIDTEAPTGFCTATINSNKTQATISVNATDVQSGIKYYQYIMDGYSTGRLTQNSYIYKENTNEVYVNLIDNAGNTNKIKCTLTTESKSSEGSSSGGSSSGGKTDSGSSSSGSNVKGNTSSINRSSGKIVGYWIYAPEDYEEKNYPMIVFLHGSGEVGSTLEDYAFGELTKNGKEYGAVIMMPRLDGKSWANDEVMTDLMSLILEVAEEYKIDKSRISISGHSLGGIGTYAMIIKYPNFFSAAAPISGRMEINDDNIEKLKNTPIWAYHGALDETVPYDLDVELINEIVRAGGNAQMTTLTNWGHGIVSKVISNDGLIDWLTTSTRQSEVKTITGGGGNTEMRLR